jgi:CDP-paratose 2-epimerase
MHKNKKRTVLIFGGAGFIGSNLAHWFLTQTGAKVHVFDNLSRQGSHHNIEWLKNIAQNGGQLELIIGDIRNRRLVEKAVSSADEIYHFAAQVAVTTSLQDPRLDFEVNVQGTFNILDAARKSRKKPFLLYTSTNKVYGDLGLGKPKRLDTRYSHPNHMGVSESQPLDFHSPYGCSKGAADQYVRDFGRIYGFPVVVFRMSCIAGPRQFGTEDQGWVAHFIYSALQRKPVTIYGDGRQVRDVLCVQDLIRAMQAVQQHLPETAGQIYNIGGGPANTTSLLELMESIRKLTSIRLNYDLDETRPGDQQVYITDHTKLTNHTGWKPQISIERTLKLLQEFWHENQRASTPSMEYTGPSWNEVQALERAS